MQLGYIGLGKMGANMVARLVEKDHDVVAFDPQEAVRDTAAATGATVAPSIAEVVAHLEANESRTLWLMVPHQVVDSVLEELVPLLAEGDVVIDGGNSPYGESVRRSAALADKGLHFLDIGVSGGPDGARGGACMMVGGSKELYDRYESLLADLCVPDGYAYMGKNGAGHFVKMVHNGIEYGMMQAIAEGFHIMKAADFDLDLQKVATVYNHGSVIESRLIQWLANAYKEHGQDLAAISGTAHASGEGEWTVKAAHELGIPDNVIHEALTARATSELVPNYQGKVVSALRNQFGGHDVGKE